jgi:hypothetical protein
MGCLFLFAAKLLAIFFVFLAPLMGANARGLADTDYRRLLISLNKGFVAIFPWRIDGAHAFWGNWWADWDSNPEPRA